MSVRFPVPASPARVKIEIAEFRGVDLYNAAANVDVRRSPDAPNMIRDEVGKVRKRTGYEVVETLEGRINGVYYLDGKRLVHAGAKLIGEDGAELYADMADERSKALQMSGKLLILDGRRLLVYDGEAVKTADADPYVPTIIISRGPKGGGVTLEPLNLLGRKWTEQFLGTATDAAYQLTTDHLDDDPVKAEKINSQGQWSEIPAAQYSVNRNTGVVTFATAPGVSPITGQDNIRITAAKTREGYADRINKCRCAALYGVGGAPDRLFVGGAPDKPNIDYHSQMDDPTFFGDTWYMAAGQDDAELVGYSVINNMLAAHKRRSEDGRNIVLRSGVMVGTDNGQEAGFPTVGALQGEGAVGRHTFGYLGPEPLFLTKLGVYAVTTAELTGERYSQQRGFYIAPALQAENNLDDAYALVWGDFYLLAVNRSVYILDGLQKAYERGAPASSFQYECYVWRDIGARVLWEQGGALWFGTDDGKLCRFYTDADSPGSYNDDGRPIMAYWDTPDLDGDNFYRNKTFRYVAVRLASAVLTGVKISVLKEGVWYPLFDAGQKARYFDWSYVDFGKLVFSSDRTPKTLGGKIAVKKVDKARFRLENSALNEPFGLYAFALEYSEGSRFRG